MALESITFYLAQGGMCLCVWGFDGYKNKAIAAITGRNIQYNYFVQRERNLFFSYTLKKDLLPLR